MMERTDHDPDLFIESLPPPVGEDMRRLDAAISEIMAGEGRTLWEGVFWGGTEQNIVGYGDYTTTRSSGEPVDWFKIGLAAQKNHISIYVNAADDDGYLVKKYADRLGKVRVGSASIAVKTLDDIDLDVLRELLQMAREQMA
jgi:hypothetical protein